MYVNFGRSPLSILSSVIHSLGFRVTEYSSYLANFFCSLVLESPVVGSNFLKTFVHASIASLYLLALVISSPII